MIIVKFEPIKGKSSITNTVVNTAAKAFADKVSQNIKSKKIVCSEHDKCFGTIIIKADENKICTVRKTGFCCTAYENAVKITVK